MKAQLECFSCNIRQAQEATLLAGKDPSFAWRVTQELCRIYSQADPNWTPAYMTTVAHRVAMQMTGNADIYSRLKSHYNQLALALYPRLKMFVASGKNRLEQAIRVAIAGNIIDLGVYRELSIDQIMEEVEGTEWGIANFAEFSQALNTAKIILYVGDNAGEIVFDRVFLEEIKDGRECVFLVKSGPIS
ncbi:MAG TPA: ARMT1-like domain-containing protein, partial [Atribacteraceae bacterium]|nr:ARMT1-like domain-containing protein [Atribacteraceae bacterium]